ncbi:MAG: CRTAC1 family protein [Verrucomicrobiota bacterium]
MSVATADIDNDLDFEIFIAQVTQGDNFREFRSEFSILSTELHHHATSETERRTAKYSADYVRAARGISLKKHRAAALTVPAGNDRDSVIRYAYFWLHFQNEAPWRDWSRFAPNHPPFFDHALRQLQAPAYELSEAESAAALPPKNRRNSLLFRNPDGTWKDEAEVRNVGITAWTWNAKFADLDNDGWLDLYSANGWPRSNYRDNNTYFHNRGDGFFDMETSAAGLDDFFVTFGFVYVDYDRDGDLDIISAPPNAEVRVFTNQSAAAGRSIRFQLRDRSANRFAVGAKITIHTDDGAQIREIQGGGGYASFDPYEAHFGLGDAAVVRRVEIDWPDGETTDLSGEFVSGFCYRILRGR